MHAVHVHVHVRAESVRDFITATLENARNSLREPGIERFEVLQQADEPTRFILIEIYRDADAPAAHKETAHYKAWRGAVEPMMAEPRRSIRVHRIPPEPYEG
ncbi:MAG: putative quinol monooxygenase [Limisphaerales bacterium]